MLQQKDIVTYSPVVKNYVNEKRAYEITTAYTDDTAANFAIEAGGGSVGLPIHAFNR